LCLLRQLALLCIAEFVGLAHLVERVAVLRIHRQVPSRFVYSETCQSRNPACCYLGNKKPQGTLPPYGSIKNRRVRACGFASVEYSFRG
jgi:hypothetical protein